MGRSGCLAGWVGVAVSLPFSLRKKLASLSLIQGRSLSAPCFNWFSLVKGGLGTFLPNHLQWMVDGEPRKTSFFSLASTMFNFLLQGTF